MKRVTVAEHPLLAVLREVDPASTPIGVPRASPGPTIVTEPKIAFARPPLSAWGGGVISVNSDSASPPNPSRTVSPESR